MLNNHQLPILKQLATLAFSLLFYLPVAAETLTVAWENYPPQQTIDSEGKLTGIDIEIAKAVLSAAGFQYTFKKVPWQRMLNFDLRNGEVDMALNAAIQEERKSFVYFSTIPYLPPQSALYILAKNKHKFNGITKLEDFAHHPLVLGVTKGILYSPKYSELLNSPDFNKKLYTSTKEAQNVQMLLAERVDGILMERYILNDLVKKIPSEKSILAHSELDFDTEGSGSYFMFSKASMSNSQVERINRALEKLKANGTLSRIIKQHTRPE